MSIPSPNRPSRDRAGPAIKRSRLALILALSVVSLALAGGAAAIPPDIQHFKIDGVTEVIPAGEACSFPLAITSTGKFRIATYFNKDGTVRRVLQNPSFRDTLTNLANGNSIQSADRGVDKTTFNPDGTVTVHGTGIHLKVKGQFFAIGLWVLTLDGETGELLDAEYHGNFDGGVEDILPFICSALA